MSAPTQYGAGVKALAVYLHQYHLVPLERTVVVFEDLCGCGISEGTLVNWEQKAASRLEATVEQIAERVATSRIQHADETGMRIGGKLRLCACEQYPLFDASGLAPEARPRRLGGDWHLAALYWASDA